MFHQSPTNHSPKLLPTNPALQNLVTDLDPQHEESISAGRHLPFIPIFLSQSSQTQSQFEIQSAMSDWQNAEIAR